MKQSNNTSSFFILLFLFIISLIVSIFALVSSLLNTSPSNNLLIQSGYISDTNYEEDGTTPQPHKVYSGTIVFPKPFGSAPIVLCQAVASTDIDDYSFSDGGQTKKQFPLFSIHVNNVTVSQFDYAKETIMNSGTQSTASSLKFFWIAIGKKVSS